MSIKDRWENLSKKKKAYAFGFLALAGVLVWAFISAGIITHDFNRSQLQTNGDRQEALINGIILTETKNEKKFWEIYGETGTYDSNNGIAMLNNVVGNFYDDQNQVSMSFESSKGTYNSQKGEIILYEDTHVVIKDGTSLKAERLKWSGADKDIVARGNVQITRNKQFLATADRIVISPNYEKFKISGNTISKIYDSKEKK